tara:strand:+ start:518 stop:754 length:237 start_codon:yes stop_codon:yes gene_type:complete
MEPAVGAELRKEIVAVELELERTQQEKAAIASMFPNWVKDGVPVGEYEEFRIIKFFGGESPPERRAGRAVEEREPNCV